MGIQASSDHLNSPMWTGFSNFPPIFRILIRTEELQSSETNELHLLNSFIQLFFCQKVRLATTSIIVQNISLCIIKDSELIVKTRGNLLTFMHTKIFLQLHKLVMSIKNIQFRNKCVDIAP